MGKSDLSGKYIFDHEDGNCAKYGQEAGSPDNLPYEKGSASMEIKQNGDVIEMKFQRPDKSEFSMSFTVGSSFEMTRRNGNKVKTSSRWEGDALVLHTEAEKPLTHTLALKDNFIVQTMSCNNVTAQAFYIKQ